MKSEEGRKPLKETSADSFGLGTWERVNGRGIQVVEEGERSQFERGFLHRFIYSERLKDYFNSLSVANHLRHTMEATEVTNAERKPPIYQPSVPLRQGPELRNQRV